MADAQSDRSLSVPIWNYVALLYPIGSLAAALIRGMPLLVAWLPAFVSLGYLMAIVGIYPGRFLVFGLKTRLQLFTFAAVVILTSAGIGRIFAEGAR